MACHCAGTSAPSTLPCARRVRAPLGTRRTRPYSGEQQRIHPAVEPGAWSREERTESERELQKMDGVGSFGAGRAGSTIDPLAFAKQPQTILRVLSWVRAGFFRYCCFGCMCVCMCVCMNVCVCVCVCVCVWWWWGGFLSVVVAARDPWRVLTANIEPRNPAIIDERGVKMETADWLCLSERLHRENVPYRV